MSNEKKGKYVPCEYCGKLTYKTPYQLKIKPHYYCSNECFSKKRSEEHKEHRTCEFCGADMYVRKSVKLRFCSVQCQNEWQKGNIGYKNPKFEGIETNCETCGKDIIVGKSHVNMYKHHFCSNQCRQEWYGDILSQDKGWREESRKRAVRILSSKQTKNTHTKPQIIMNNILDSISIEYINEKNFKYYSIDNYLPAYNLAIEVNGDYWHTSPLIYDSPTNDMQRKIISRDNAKRTYLKRWYDINVLYIWESDIYKNSELCKALIKKYINAGGILPNYNSFNYHLNEHGGLELNKEIIKSFQEFPPAKLKEKIVG